MHKMNYINYGDLCTQFRNYYSLLFWGKQLNFNPQNFESTRLRKSVVVVVAKKYLTMFIT